MKLRPITAGVVGLLLVCVAGTQNAASDSDECDVASLSDYNRRFVDWAFDETHGFDRVIRRDTASDSAPQVVAFFGFDRLPVEPWQLVMLVQYSNAPSLGILKPTGRSESEIDTAIAISQKATATRRQKKIGGAVGRALEMFSGESNEPPDMLAVLKSAGAGAEDAYLERELGRLRPQATADELLSVQACRIVRFRANEQIGSTVAVVGAGSNRIDDVRCVATALLAHFGFSNAAAIYQDDSLLLKPSDIEQPKINLSLSGYFNRLYGSGDKRHALARGASRCEVVRALAN